MTTPAVREHQSPLESVLLDVQATLAELLVAADEQHAAIVAHDRDRLESVTRQQERLSSQLARAEARRSDVLGGVPLFTAISSSSTTDEATRLRALADSIGVVVRQLKQRQVMTASLLEQGIDLAAKTLDFLRRLVTVESPVYGARGVASSQSSLLVDRRA